MSRYKPLGLLPNTRGYRFIGLTHDGKEVACMVAKALDGTHYVSSSVGYSELRSWRPQ